MTLKEKIVIAAFDVFAEKGYQKATVGDIIKRAESSKGGFYHHFNSKEELLGEITEYYICQMEERFEAMLAQSNLTTLEQMNQIFVAINSLKKEQVQDWPKLQNLYGHKDSHIILRKMADDFEKLTGRIILKLLKKANAEAMIHMDYPEELAGLWSRELLRIYVLVPTLIYSSDPKELEGFIRLTIFMEMTINNALHLEDGTIKIKEPALHYINEIKMMLADAK